MRIKSAYYNSHGGLNVGAQPYCEATKSYEDKPSSNSKQEPLDEFNIALEALTSLAVRMCEFPTDWKSKIEVLGITVKYLEGGYLSALFKLSRRMEEGEPHIFTTPTRAITTEDEEDAFASTEEALAVERVLDEARRYYNDERKSLDRPLEEKNEETRTAHAKGREAYGQAGSSIMDNPYLKERDGDDPVDSWDKGFMDAQKEANIAKQDQEEAEV